MEIKARSLSIIGMKKNAGKTTCLNSILESNAHLKIGLTSIGRDGEKEDSVYKVSKPSIYVNKGTLVATTDMCLDNSSAEFSVINKTNINTPLGVVYVVEITTAGYVDLAGPSYNKQINEVKDLMDVDLFIVDGAFSRKQMAANPEIESTILVTGASFSRDVDEVVKETVSVYNLFRLSKTSFGSEMFDNAVTIIGDRTEILDLETSLGSSSDIVDKINLGTTDLILSGALTMDFVDELKNHRYKIDTLTIHVQDGTKVFLDSEYLKYLKQMKIELRVLHEIDLISIVYNPYSPLGYEFDDEDFRSKLAEHIDLPLINVLKKGRDMNE